MWILQCSLLMVGWSGDLQLSNLKIEQLCRNNERHGVKIEFHDSSNESMDERMKLSSLSSCIIDILQVARGQSLASPSPQSQPFCATVVKVHLALFFDLT